MNPHWRLGLLLTAFVAIAPAVWAAAHALPPFGRPVSLYGPAVNALGPTLRNVSNMVAAVNFDFRGFDTLGEESMLIGAVTGAVVLLRGARGESGAEHAGRLGGRAIVRRASATTLICRIAAMPMLLFGIYVALHGTVTPGGGFQGGAAAASSLLLVYLGEGYSAWRSILRSPILAIFEGAGGLAFVAAAALPLLRGHAALQNVLPLGRFKDLYSGGLMVVVNLAIAAAVIGSFGLLLIEFLEETRAPQDDPVPDEAQG